MKASICFLAILYGGALQFSNATKVSVSKDHMRRVLQSMKVDTTHQFADEESLHAHMESVLSFFQEDEHHESHESHNFIITFKNSADAKVLRDSVLHPDLIVRPLHKNCYQVSLPLASLNFLIRTAGHTFEVLPIIPATKIHQHVYDMPSYCPSPEDEEKSIAVEIAALSPDCLEAFTHWLTDSAELSSPHPPFTVATGKLLPNRQKFIRVTMKCSDVISVAKLFSERAEVLWMEKDSSAKTCNYWARGVVESGNYQNAPIVLTADLRGTNQIIGIADTGIDLNSTYFYDSIAMDFNSPTANTEHRKVVSYSFIPGEGDNEDDAEAHGTHGKHYIVVLVSIMNIPKSSITVCGIAAGLAYGEDDYGDFRRFNGLSTAAKISFFDISVTGSAPGSVSLPPDINQDLFGMPSM